MSHVAHVNEAYHITHTCAPVLYYSKAVHITHMTWPCFLAPHIWLVGQFNVWCSQFICVMCAPLYCPRVEWRGLTVFARRSKACVFRNIIYVTLFWNLEFLQNILELRLSLEIPSRPLPPLWRSHVARRRVSCCTHARIILPTWRIKYI